jgi:hypothetical protein
LDITFFISSAVADLRGLIVYNPDLFLEDDVLRFVDEFGQDLRAIALEHRVLELEHPRAAE